MKINENQIKNLLLKAIKENELKYYYILILDNENICIKFLNQNFNEKHIILIDIYNNFNVLQLVFKIIKENKLIDYNTIENLYKNTYLRIDNLTKI